MAMQLIISVVGYITLINYKTGIALDILPMVSCINTEVVIIKISIPIKTSKESSGR